MAKAFITKDVLRWARESAKMTIEIAASKVPCDPEKLDEWETSSSNIFPTITQAEKLAKIYRRPLAVFYLPSIPKDFQLLRDFRSRNKDEFSTALIFMMREIQEKQDWLKTAFVENSESKLEFVGKFSISNSPEEVSEDIRRTLNITTSELEKNPLKYWIEHTEAKRIFISLSSFFHTRMLLDINEVKGFAIADKYAPFVFINSEDWPNAQLFTLVHELAHIWINESGVSNETEINFRDNMNLDPIEVFCNEVAANALIPVKEINAIFSNLTNITFSNISSISKRLGVSNITLLIRALNLNFISKNEFNNFKVEADRQFLEYIKVQEKKELRFKEESDSPPIYYPLKLKRNGKLFSHVVLDYYKGGRINGLEASDLLSVKINKFSKYENYLNK